MEFERRTRSMGREKPRAEGWRLRALPDDIYVKIFCLLPAGEIANSCSLVCRSWRQFSSSDLLWRELCRRAGLRDTRSVLDASHLKTWRSLFIALYGTNLIASPHFERVDRIDAKRLRARVVQSCEPQCSLSADRFFSEDENHEEGYSYCHWVAGKSKSRFESAGGDGIVRECPPVDCLPFPGAPGKPVLATSYDWGNVHQCVDLGHFPRGFLDQCPPLLVSVWYAGQRGTFGLFRIEVGLRDERNRVMCSRTSENFRAQPGKWRKGHLVIVDYPKGMWSVYVKLSGMSMGKKKGFQGAKFTSVRMEFVTASY